MSNCQCLTDWSHEQCVIIYCYKGHSVTTLKQNQWYVYCYLQSVIHQIKQARLMWSMGGGTGVPRYLIFDFLGCVISDIWLFLGGLISDIWFLRGSNIWYLITFHAPHRWIITGSSWNVNKLIYKTQVEKCCCWHDTHGDVNYHD